MTETQPVPENRGHAVPYLCVEGADEAIAFYTEAFGAVETMRMSAPDGRIVHAEMDIGGLPVFVADDFPEMMGGKESSPTGLGGTTVSLHCYVPDCDAAMARAVAAGAEVTFPVDDMFWGDRFGRVRDPFGHEWSFATHIRDVPPEEIEAATAAMFAPDA